MLNLSISGARKISMNIIKWIQMGVFINADTTKWRVYKGKSHLEMDDDRGIPIPGHLQMDLRAFSRQSGDDPPASQRLCKERLNDLLAGWPVLQGQTGIHLSTLGQLVASKFDSGLMKSVGIRSR